MGVWITVNQAYNKLVIKYKPKKNINIPDSLRVLSMQVYAIELYPIATPNKWSKTVPKQKPEINIYGLITYGIDIPWAAPWVIPNEKIITLI